MAKEYETFVRDSAQILSGREVALALRDLTPGKKKYRGINVRAVVSRPPKKGAPTLWIRSVVGVKESQPASVHIVEELPEALMATPYTDFFEVLKKVERP
jgi:hypothetical protein